MNKKVLTLEELLTHLQAQRFLDEEDLRSIAENLEKSEGESKDPLYIRILSGMGAWVAALFLILFLGISQIIVSGAGALICGLLFFAGGICIGRGSKATFLNQLSLALVFSGNILVLFGSGEASKVRDISVLVITQAVVCAIAYPLFPNSIYRFLAPTALVILITAWIIHARVSVLIHVLIAAETLFAGKLLLIKKRRASLNPLVYSAATLLPVTLLFMNFMQVNLWGDVHRLGMGFRQPLWPSSIVLAMGLIYLYLELARSMKSLHEPWMILAILSTLLLGIFTTPGILVAMGLLVIGYAFEDRVLTGLSYGFFPCFLVLFYYALDINLAQKSWVITASGVLLLVVRWIAGCLNPARVSP